jgi:hypothetical protein
MRCLNDRSAGVLVDTNEVHSGCAAITVYNVCVLCVVGSAPASFVGGPSALPTI